MYFMVYLSISTAHLPFRKKRSQDLDVDMTQIQRKKCNSALSGQNLKSTQAFNGMVF